MRDHDKIAIPKVNFSKNIWLSINGKWTNLETSCSPEDSYARQNYR